MIRRSAFIALARAASAAFFLATSLYCLLSYNAFAYQQFIRPHLISALTDFTVWHGVLYWIALLATVATLLAGRSTRAPRRVWMFLAVSAAIGVWLLAGQVLPQTENSWRSLVLAVAFLLPPIWLAIVDHLDTRVAPVEASDNGRVLIGAVAAALVTWITYAAASPLRPRPSGAMEIATRELVLGASSSAITHLTVFVVFALIAITIRELVAAARLRPKWEYALLVGTSALAVGLIVAQLIFAPIAFRGPAAWIVAALVGTVIASTWSSIARYRVVDSPAAGATAMEIWLAPVSSGGSRLLPIAGLILLPPAAFYFTSRAAVFDWNFMLQELVALMVWLLAFGFVHAALRDMPGKAGQTGFVVPLVVLGLFSAQSAAMPRLADWLHDSRLRTDFVLDGYAAVDPSYKLIRDTLTTDPGADPGFYAYLRANSTIDPHVPVTPFEINFVKPLEPAPGHKPNIFFFLIDSLRPDYLAPYNDAVTFTPRIASFASETGTHVFKRSFSRYGGTALSMPAVFAGGMILHQLYVTPFAPMNALEKLLDANGYHRALTKDSIAELFTPSPSSEWLNADTPEMEHTFCDAARAVEAIASRRPGGAPLFVHTRTLDLHVSLIRSAVPPPGESYPGFNDVYASRVHRIDECFGQTIDALKKAGLYDDSIIVLSADHGDSLGEEQRWGHAYTIFPEVMRIPLIVHLPPPLQGVTADLERVSTSTDITPTLYALLGYDVADLGPLFGLPLFGWQGSERFGLQPIELSNRRRDSLLVASSYGAVYGLLSHNGRSLYIADGINEREYAYDLIGGAVGRRVGLSDADRASSRQLIRDDLAQIAAEYRFSPRP